MLFNRICPGVALAVALSCCIFTLSPCHAFVFPSASSSRDTTTLQASQDCNNDDTTAAATDGPFDTSRRNAVKSMIGAATIGAGSSSMFLPLLRPANADIEGVATPTFSDAPATKIDAGGAAGTGGGSSGDNGGGVTMYKTKSGLKYIEIAEGTGPSPQYGQLVSISYKAYVKLPDIQGQPQKLEEFDSDSAFLIKHGNGRTVPGLDEGIHTMRVGGKRRLIVPAKLGYVATGLGPIPESPLGRYRLNKLLDRMVEVKGGNVVFDVTMRNVLSDEADQGYYSDDSLSPEDFDRLKNNVQQRGIEAREAQATQV